MRSRETKNPRVVLLEDHRQLDLHLDRLLAVVRSSEREAGERMWKQVEDALLRHLDVEEMFVFPALHEGHPLEVDRLRKEHDEIRRQMGEIGLALELHTLRAETIESFCTLLRDHAEREDALAYVQAGRALSIGVARIIAARVKAAIARTRRATSPRTRRSGVREARALPVR
jgi:hemerythrin-like domain-containing protein